MVIRKYQIHSRRYFIKINKRGNMQKGVSMKVNKSLEIIMEKPVKAGEKWYHTK